MRTFFSFAIAMGFGAINLFGQSDSLMVASIFEKTLTDGDCYENLRYLCKNIGPRLSGSENAEKAILWGFKKLKSYSPDTVYLQEVQVPHWVRGDKEEASFTLGGKHQPITISALGGSVGTDGKLTAPVVEVKYFEDLEKLGRENIEGKIVFYNRALDPVLINTGMAYGGAYEQRSKGASEAAKYGAVGVLVRSLTHARDQRAHTGSMNYQEGVDQIPAAAISTVHAQQLSNAIKSNSDTEVTLELSCQKLPDVVQHNVIAEIQGSEYPEQIILVGGHLDSWDIGEGAHDDGAGIVHSIEVLKNLKELNYQPKKTIRIVLFINEENGNNG
ncbi:MAG: M28 family peptidase, partial [Bacteroidota bacterium]